MFIVLLLFHLGVKRGSFSAFLIRVTHVDMREVSDSNLSSDTVSGT